MFSYTQKHSGAWTDLSAENVLVPWSRLLSSGLLFQNHRGIIHVFCLSEWHKTWAVM